MRPTRKIIAIDESKCNGCGQCVTACHEGALAMVDGKAKLVKDNFCDGLGACIGDCPQAAITIIEREADPFAAPATDPEQASALWGGTQPGTHRQSEAHAVAHAPLRVVAGEPEGKRPCGCPGSAVQSLSASEAERPHDVDSSLPPSMLSHWPVQLMLVPPQAAFLRGADLVVCADCVPFTVPDFHARYLSGRAVLVGCPKLDDLDYYRDKLAAIMQEARPRRLTILRMEVPCCRGLADACVQAALGPGLTFPIEEHVAGIRGGITCQIIQS